VCVVEITESVLAKVVFVVVAW